jgi:hypothetical protein
MSTLTKRHNRVDLAAWTESVPPPLSAYRGWPPPRCRGTNTRCMRSNYDERFQVHRHTLLRSFATPPYPAPPRRIGPLTTPHAVRASRCPMRVVLPQERPQVPLVAQEWEATRWYAWVRQSWVDNLSIGYYRAWAILLQIRQIELRSSMRCASRLAFLVGHGCLS